MKIGFFEVEGWEEAIVRAKLPGHELSFFRDPVNAGHLPVEKGFEAIITFVDSRVTKEVVDYFPSLKFVAPRSTGYDHIDREACRKRGIIVSYVPGYGDNTVAEFTFGLILNLTRKIYQAIDQMKERGSFALDGLRGIDIKGKTLGVVGTGRIGREVIKIAKGFGMNVVAFDPMPNDAAAKELGFSYAAFDELLRTADIVSIHCPYSEKTHHLINQGNIDLMKKGAYLVNTARGPILETEAVMQGLQSGTLAGVGIDVIEEEGETKDELAFIRGARPNEAELRTMIENHVLMKMPNVLMTPHNAFNSQEALERILHTTLENITGFTQGAPKNVVPS